jgi:hypothetical protein
MIEGECVCPHDGALPAPAELWINTLEKINDPNNEAYVDAVFAAVADRLVVTDISPHWLRSFGTFVGRAANYRYNISEEYPSLRRKGFWERNQALGIFGVEKVEMSDEMEEGPCMEFSDALDMDDSEFEMLGDETNVEPASDQDGVVSVDDIPIDDVENVKLSPPVRIYPMTSKKGAKGSSGSSGSSDSSGSGCDDDDDDDDDHEYFATFKNFPVQVTLLERAEGTMEDLLMEDIPVGEKERQWAAWIFQVIAALSAAQHLFGFVHNDLHTNNVMWVRTNKPYIYYRIHPKKGDVYVYRVPTYGYLMKIIDFGRATYWLPEPAGFFISDAFFPGNDAAYQYNCEPFFDTKLGKKIEPNPSFDLCRLAVSLLDSLYPTCPDVAKPVKVMSREGSKTYPETVSPLYNMMWEWLTDDAGKNVRRTPSGEERYPDFDLYSAIAKDVHKAIPIHQVERTLFANAFRYESKDSEVVESMYDIWIR